MAEKTRDIGVEILRGLREIKRGDYGRVINVPEVTAMRDKTELPQRRLEKYSQGLESGLLTIEEVVGAVLDELAEVPDRAERWMIAPKLLQREVLAYLTRVGVDNVPPAWVIGVDDPEWREAQTSRRKQVALELLKR